MSLANPTEKKTVNPSRFFLEWDNGGFFTYYDKETKQKQKFNLPVKFYVLDSLIQIKGYNSKLEKGYYSNALKPKMLKDSKFKIQIDGKVSEEAFFEDLRVLDQNVGRKVFKNPNYELYSVLYVAFRPDEIDESILSCISIKGAVSAEFFEFKKKVNIERSGICIEDFDARKKGNISFSVPVFKKYDNDSHRVEAIDMEKQYLQPYFDDYFKENKILDESSKNRIHDDSLDNEYFI
jgi:hypothetical protein